MARIVYSGKIDSDFEGFDDHAIFKMSNADRAKTTVKSYSKSSRYDIMVGKNRRTEKARDGIYRRNEPGPDLVCKSGRNDTGRQ